MDGDTFPILCMVDGCGITSKGNNAYLQHMQTHSQTEQLMKQNIPKDTPIVKLDKDVPPSKEFMELASMMDQPKSQPPPVKLETKVSTPVTQGEVEQDIKPIVLRYRYEGNCEKCNTPIRTIMVKVNGKAIAIAYCLTHEEVQQREVYPIEETLEEFYSKDRKEQEFIVKEVTVGDEKQDMTPDEINDMYKNADTGKVQDDMMKDIETQMKKRKVVVKHAKRKSHETAKKSEGASSYETINRNAPKETLTHVG